MQILWILLFIISTVTGCTDANKDSNEDMIVGAWKLIKGEYYGINQDDQFGMITVDYTSKNCMYVFNSNKVLQITGASKLGYKNGAYSYVLEEDYLTGAPNEGESKILLVKINDSKWTFEIEDGIMKLGQSYVDGPDLYFERE